MNSEIRFAAALLSANRSEQEEFWMNHPPLSVFRLHQNEMGWVFLHRQKHGFFPSRNLFYDRFDIKLPKSREVLSEALHPVLVNSSYVDIREIVEKVSKAYEEKKNPNEIVAQFRDEVMRITSFSTAFADERMSDPKVAFARYRIESELSLTQLHRITTPWAGLTNVIGGSIRPSEVMVIAARPYLGKTWVACSIAEHAASNCAAKTLFISKEMPMAQVSERITAIRYKLPYLRLRNRELTVHDLVKWKLGVMRNKKFPLIISGDETFVGTTLDDVNAKVEKERPDCLIVDGAYLLSVPGIPPHKERETFAAISKGAKRIAKANKLPVVLVLQMNREADHLDAKSGKSESRGGLSTLYGADAWGQDADYVIEVRGSPGSKERELFVHKARDAGVGSVLINFDLDRLPDFGQKVRTAEDLKLKIKPL